MIYGFTFLRCWRPHLIWIFRLFRSHPHDIDAPTKTTERFCRQWNWPGENSQYLMIHLTLIRFFVTKIRKWTRRAKGNGSPPQAVFTCSTCAHLATHLQSAAVCRVVRIDNRLVTKLPRVSFSERFNFFGWVFKLNIFFLILKFN